MPPPLISPTHQKTWMSISSGHSEGFKSIIKEKVHKCREKSGYNQNGSFFLKKFQTENSKKQTWEWWIKTS